MPTDPAANPPAPGALANAGAPAPLRRAWLYLGVVLAAVVAVVLNEVLALSVTIKTEDFTLFAVFYLVAQATERCTEPLMGSQKVAPQTEVLKAEVGAEKTKLMTAKALTVADNVSPGQLNDVQAQLDAAQKRLAETQKQLSDAQSARAVRGWAVASIFALLACGLLNLGLIGTVADVQAADGWKLDVFSAVDVIITGLAVGAGTKPLHDLITRIEKGKEKADPATDAAVPTAG